MILSLYHRFHGLTNHGVSQVCNSILSNPALTPGLPPFLPQSFLQSFCDPRIGEAGGKGLDSVLSFPALLLVSYTSRQGLPMLSCHACQKLEHQHCHEVKTSNMGKKHLLQWWKSPAGTEVTFPRFSGRKRKDS